MLRLLKQRPNRFKYNKSFRNKIYRLSKIKNLIISKISFGTVGVQTLESAKIQYYQIEYFRKALLKYCKNKVKIWFRLSFVVPMTKKSAQMRMGKGKGKLQKFVANVFSGSTIFELEHSKSDIWKLFFYLIPTLKKFCLKTKIRTNFNSLFK